MNLSTHFRYLAPASRLHVGGGTLSQLASEAARAAARRAFVVAGRTVSRETSLVQQVRDALGPLYAGCYDGAVRESPLPSVMAGVEALRAAQPDLIVAVGGGSAIVTARAMTIIFGEGRTVEEMYTRHTPGQPPVVYRANAPKLPMILVPTTPTTGADRGGAAVYDEQPPHRKELYDPKTRPLAVIVDPAALLTAPPSLYMDTALTTFCGVVDALQSAGHPALSYGDYRQALDLSLAYLPEIVSHPIDPEPRIQLFMASVLANRASQSTYNLEGRARTTSLDRTIRYQYPDVGQGASNAALLSTIMRLNADILTEGQAGLADLLQVRRPGASAAEAAEAAAAAIDTFLQSIKAPARLRDLGIPREDFPRLAEREAASPAFGQGLNRITGVDELLKLLEQAW